MIKYRIGILFLCGLLFAGCIKEDWKDCPNDPYELLFIYNGDGTTDIFNSKIEDVQLYVFNMDGSYVNSYHLIKNQLNGFQGFQSELLPGEYHIVCWGNVTNQSTINGEENSLNRHYLYNNYYLTDNPIQDFDSLYYSRQQIVIPTSGGKDTAYFSSAHINMEIYVEGLSTGNNITRAVNDPQGWFVVRHINVGYDFSMNVTQEESTMYPDLMDAGNNFLVSRFNLLRFRNENNIFIDLYSGDGQLVYTLNLAAFMQENNIMVEGINEAAISITIRFMDTSVQVSVTDWDSEIVKPIL